MAELPTETGQRRTSSEVRPRVNPGKPARVKVGALPPIAELELEPEAALVVPAVSAVVKAVRQRAQAVVPAAETVSETGRSQAAGAPEALAPSAVAVEASAEAQHAPAALVALPASEAVGGSVVVAAVAGEDEPVELHE